MCLAPSGSRNCSDLPISDADKRGRTQMMSFLSAFVRGHPHPMSPTLNTYGQMRPCRPAGAPGIAPALAGFPSRTTTTVVTAASHTTIRT